MSKEEYFYILRKEKTSDDDREFIRKMYGDNEAEKCGDTIHYSFLNKNGKLLYGGAFHRHNGKLSYSPTFGMGYMPHGEMIQYIERIENGEEEVIVPDPNIIFHEIDFLIEIDGNPDCHIVFERHSMRRTNRLELWTSGIINEKMPIGHRFNTTLIPTYENKCGIEREITDGEKYEVQLEVKEKFQGRAAGMWLNEYHIFMEIVNCDKELPFKKIEE